MGNTVLISPCLEKKVNKWKLVQHVTTSHRVTPVACVLCLAWNVEYSNTVIAPIFALGVTTIVTGTVFALTDNLTGHCYDVCCWQLKI